MAGRQLISRPSRRGFNIILRKPDPGHAPLRGVGRLVVITTAKGAANLVFIAPKPRLKFSVGNGRPKCFPAVDGLPIRHWAFTLEGSSTSALAVGVINPLQKA